MTPSITGSARTNWKSCCGMARTGWLDTPTRGASPGAICVINGVWPARRWRGWKSLRTTPWKQRRTQTDSAGDAAITPDWVSITAEEAPVEAPLSLNEARMRTVMAELAAAGVETVVDLGCGDGKLLSRLLKERRFTRLVGLDVSARALEIAADRLHLDRLPPRLRERIQLWHGGLTYRDARIEGFDAATVIEVIEHLDENRLAAFERVLFQCARPRWVIVTTPNVEYNVNYEFLPAGRPRHPDHRFEWTRAEFESWSTRVAATFGYAVRFVPVGEVDPAVGAPTQMAVFARCDDGSRSNSPPQPSLPLT